MNRSDQPSPTTAHQQLRGLAAELAELKALSGHVLHIESVPEGIDVYGSNTKIKDFNFHLESSSEEEYDELYYKERNHELALQREEDRYLEEKWNLDVEALYNKANEVIAAAEARKAEIERKYKDEGFSFAPERKSDFSFVRDGGAKAISIEERIARDAVKLASVPEFVTPRSALVRSAPPSASKRPLNVPGANLFVKKAPIKYINYEKTVADERADKIKAAAAIEKDFVEAIAARYCVPKGENKVKAYNPTVEVKGKLTLKNKKDLVKLKGAEVNRTRAIVHLNKLKK